MPHLDTVNLFLYLFQYIQIYYSVPRVTLILGNQKYHPHFIKMTKKSSFYISLSNLSNKHKLFALRVNSGKKWLLDLGFRFQ